MITPSNRIGLGLSSLATLALLSACQEPASTPAMPEAATAAPAAPAPQAAVAATNSLVELNASDRQVVLQPSKLCNLERIGDDLLGSTEAYATSNPSALVVHGWVGDEASNQPPNNPMLMVRQIGGARVWQMPIELNVKRADVAKYKNAPGLEATGFSTPADLSGLPAGTYRMLLVHDRDGGRYACDNGRNLRIEG